MLVNNRQIFLRATEVPAFGLVVSKENSLSQNPVKPARRLINLALSRVLSLGERLNM